MNTDDPTSPSARWRAALRRTTSECPTHGAYECVLVGKQVPACPQCAHEVESKASSERQAREMEAARDRALDSARIIGRYRGATFANFLARTPAQRTVLATCREFAAEVTSEQGSGLWLLGPTGVGKSHLGCAIAQALIFERGLTAKIATARDIVRALRATWRPHADETENDVIARIAALDCLVLDEVGAGFGTDAELAQLLDVVDARYQLRRPTVLLSNLSEPQIKAALGDRLYERLREGATVLVCRWESHRKKGPFVACTEAAEGEGLA